MQLLLDTNVISDFVRGEPLVRQALLESITVLSHDPADARETGDIRAALESGGQPIGP
jgi:predicted nucleic acid-binding protein